MFTRPAFKSRLRLARRVRMSLARLSASILWVSDRSGAGPRSLAVSALGGVCETVGTGGIYTRLPASVGHDLDEIAEIHLHLELRSRPDWQSVSRDVPRRGGKDGPIRAADSTERHEFGADPSACCGV